MDKLVTRLLSDLSAHPPDLLIVESNLVSSTEKGLNLWMDPRVFTWFSTRYDQRPLNPMGGHFILHARRDSKLEARMKAETGTLKIE